MIPDIPPDALTRISPILESLERSFRPLAQTLIPAEEPDVTFLPSQEPAE